MLNKFVYYVKWLPSKMVNNLQLKLRRVKIGINVRILGTLVIRGRGEIEIGNQVKINSCRDSNPIGGDTKTSIFVKPNGKLTIGNNTGISNSAIFCESSITIGNNVFIGNSCKIYDSDFHSLDYDDRVSGIDAKRLIKPIIIEDGAFIGAHSIILKGVRIGSKSIIGSGSVVTKDIPTGEVWAGNPARFIRKI